MVLHKDKEYRAVVFAASPDLPMIGGLARPRFKRNIAGRLPDPHDDLVTRRALVGMQLVFERCARVL